MYFKAKGTTPSNIISYNRELSVLKPLLKPFLKGKVCLKCFKHLKAVLSHYINYSLLKKDYYILIT